MLPASLPKSPICSGLLPMCSLFLHGLLVRSNGSRAPHNHVWLSTQQGGSSCWAEGSHPRMIQYLDPHATLPGTAVHGRSWVTQISTADRYHERSMALPTGHLLV